jgi:H+/Cl- antiporter ClcA
MSQQWFKKITKNQLFWSFELSFSLVFLCVFIYLASNLETIINYDVITTLSIVVSSVVSFATTIAILLNRQNEQNGSHNKLWPLVSTVVASAYAFVAGIFGYFVSIIFSMAFRQMTFDILSASVLLATLGGLISYYLYEHVSKFDRSNFARLIFVQYIGGFFLAARPGLVERIYLFSWYGYKWSSILFQFYHGAYRRLALVLLLLLETNI